MDFGRLITAMVTPFTAEGQIDWETTGKLIDHLIDVQQSEGLVISGTTGEAPTLSDEERLELFRFAVKHAAGRCRIIAGTGTNSTKHTIEISRAAEACGVDALLLVAPYYNRPSQAGLYEHFRAVAEATNLPIILYNISSRTAVDISAETTLKLAQIDNIVATKDCASLDQIAQIVANAPEGFTVYSGDDSATLPALAIGCHGVISVASHLIGSQMKQMIDAYVSGNVSEATKLHLASLPLFKGLMQHMPNPVGIKHALKLSGLPVGGVRLPLVNPNEEEGELIARLLR